jgi:hypothetical protein
MGLIVMINTASLVKIITESGHEVIRARSIC